MKIFPLFAILAMLCSIANAQVFFIQNPDSNIQTSIDSWVRSKGFNTVSISDSSSHILTCEFIEKDKNGKGNILFTVVNNKTKRLSGQTVDERIRKNSSSNFLEVADQQLETVLKKIKANEDLKIAKVFFKETKVDLVRGREDSIKYVNIIFGGSPKDNFEVKITKTSDAEDVSFNDYYNQQTIYLTGKGGETSQLELRVKADTTIKDRRFHPFQLSYRKVGDVNYISSEGLKVTVDVISPKGNSPQTFKKVDFLLYIGTTLDPNNNTNKIKGLSIEGVIPFQMTKRIWTRVGGYMHPNFSRDSSSIAFRNYYRLDNSNLINNQTPIGRSYGRVDAAEFIESLGLYADIFRPLDYLFGSKIHDGVRFSPFVHLEWARRNINPKIQYTQISSDTIKYSSILGIDTLSLRTERFNEKSIFPKRVYSQFYAAVGFLVEANFSDVNLFVQPYIGYRWQYETFVSRPSERSKGEMSLGFKLAVKLFNSFNISADVKDMFTDLEYINISFGIPISLTEALKKK